MKPELKAAALALALLGMASCQKEITLPYRSIEPLMVVEGSVCQDSAVVRISQTLDMEEPFENMKSISGAEVSLEFGQQRIPLVDRGDGLYSPEGGFHGIPGTDYTLSVERNGQKFRSTSTMKSRIIPLVNGFRTLEITGTKCWLYEALLLDTKDEENYYSYYVYMHGKLVGWDVVYDKGNDGGLIPIDAVFLTEDLIPEGVDIDEDELDFEILHEGEELTLEVRSIDKRTYDYLYSLVVSGMSYSNAIENFTYVGNSKEKQVCLGLFSSYSSLVFKEVFNMEETYPDINDLIGMLPKP